MKKEYVKPEAQIQKFELEDAVMSSLPGGSGSISGSTNPEI